MKININDETYPYFKQIFIVLFSNTWKPFFSQLGGNPIELMNQFELKSKTQAKRALKMGLADLISQIKDYSPELKSVIDAELAANQLASLSELQGIETKTISKVLKRKKINNYEEYSLVKEVVIDMDSELTTTDRSLLDSYLAEFRSQSV